MVDYDKILAAAQARQANTPTAKEHQVGESTLQLEEIGDRFLPDTRQLDQKHVTELAESIAVLGLIEPLVVDNQKRLLAGGHRREAIRVLKDEQAEAFDRHFPNGAIPVRTMPFDSEKDTDLALAIETAENEKRRDYSREEVRAIASRLKEAGFEDLSGRPRAGQKPLMPALAVVVGKNRRTIQRYLYGKESVKSKTDVQLLHLRQALSSLQKWKDARPRTTEEKELAKLLPDVLRAIARAIESRD